MAVNDCNGSQYGGNIKHTLFLGCTVSDYEVSAGWSDQVTQVTITLYQDDCEAPVSKPKYYYDLGLTQRTTTDADPGFIGEVVPIIGCAAYFRHENFEFCGLIQAWERENSSSVNPEYTVTLVSPIKILEETQIVLGKYAGPLKPNSLFSTAPNNVFNVYGFAESFSSVEAPLYYQSSEGVYSPGDGGIDGAVFGTPAGGYGGANVNDNGMQWSIVRSMINIMTSAIPKVSNGWTPHGRITHRAINLGDYGSPWTNGYGLLNADTFVNSRYISQYFLDISELPNLPSYFRFPNITISLLDIINSVTDNAGYEYFVELLPIKSGGTIHKVIKIRAVNRNFQPAVGEIASFISIAESNDTLISSSLGQEFRNKQTSSFLIGGNKETIYQAYQSTDPEGDGDPVFPEDDNMILPYIGKDNNNNMIVPYLEGGQWKFDVDVTDLNNSLRYVYFDTNSIQLSEYELLAATSMKTWEEYISSANTDSYFYITGDDLGLLQRFEQSYSKINTVITGIRPKYSFNNPNHLQWEGETTVTEFEQFSRDIKDFKAEIFPNSLTTLEILNDVQKDKETIYKWIAGFAANFGSKYAVRVPYASPYLDTESQTIQFSEEPSSQGWTEESTIIGLPNGTVYSDYFSDVNGKINAFTRFYTASGLELDGVSNSDFLTYDGDLYLKCSVDSEYVFHDYNNFTVPRAVITLSDVITESEEFRPANQAVIGNLLRAYSGIDSEILTGVKNIYSNIAEAAAYDYISARPIMPDAVAIGIKSNVNSYGPWSSVGPAGGIRIEKNEGLVPWEYGSYSTMNTVGQALANAGLTNMQYGEMGSVTIAGLPDLPIGAEINSASAVAGKNLIENRTISYTTFNGSLVGGSPVSYNSLIYNYGFSLDGTYGPNITNIALRFGDGGFQTTYNMRTYTPIFGKLAELNAERLRQIGQNNIRNAKQFRFNAFRGDIQQSQLEAPLTQNAIESMEKRNNKLFAKAKNLRKAWEGGSPHEIFAGQNGVWQSGQCRSVCASYSINELSNTLSTAYGKKAFVSLEGLIRPFSTSGGFNLPRYPTPATGAVGGLTVYASDSGYDITGTGAGTAVLSLYDFNPYFNPVGYNYAQLAAKHTGTYGHDIDIVARGTGIPDNLVSRHKNTGTAFEYDNEYRPMALKGPLLIHGWGYGLDGKPVPNQEDNEDDIRLSGVYKTTGLDDNFYPDFGQRADLWPVAPLDVYYDRGRAVWTFKEQSDLHVRTLQHIGPQGSGLCLVIDPITQETLSGQYLDTSGNLIDRPVVYGFDIDDRSIASGTKLRLKYNNDRSRLEINSHSNVTVLITDTVQAASFSSSTSGLTPKMFTAYSWLEVNETGGGDPGVLYYNTGYIITGWNRYPDTITVGSNKGYIAQVEDGWLDNGSCTEITL